MLEITGVTNAEKAEYLKLDNLISQSELELKIIERRVQLIKWDKVPVGVLRWTSFWDEIPFLNLIFLKPAFRGQGFGHEALDFWEMEMRRLGVKQVMTSTQSDEMAQHFYRKSGYLDKGVLTFDGTTIEQASELFFIKNL